MRKYFRFRWLPWMVVGVILVIALLHEILQPPWIANFSRGTQAAFWGLALGVMALAFLILRQIAAYQEEQERMRQRMEQAERLVVESYERLEAIFQISQKFVEASDEKEVIELVLRLSVDLVGAMGASFVPLDEHGQPATTISHGELPFPVLEAWVEYLASPAIRERCKNCGSHATLAASCPLLKGPFSDAVGMYCLPLRRGNHEFGVLNLFIPNVERLDTKTQSFLRALMDETALALEGVRLRRRELSALRQMQALREKTDLSGLLYSLLENVHHTLEADFAMLVTSEAGGEAKKVELGSIPPQNQSLVDGILQGVMASGEPVLLGEVAGDSFTAAGAVRSLLAAPLMRQDRSSTGVLLVANRRSGGFHPRQLALLQTFAGQAALVIQNANLMAELEYKTMIQERTRLAREIHDGLAQTLGFLKLQTAQMKNYLARNELERLRQSTNLCYSTLSEAYQDVRQAIDGLRIWPAESGLRGWLDQTVKEFAEVSGIPTRLECPDEPFELLPEVHAQLIRILQEALTNIRKHAQANAVEVSCRKVGNDLWLEVRDNGSGFAPQDLSAPSQHGLQGMRERAELIGADFQVISCPQEGTTVRVCVPSLQLRGLREGEAN